MRDINWKSLIFFITFLSFSSNIFSQTIERIFVFGDSLSDVGQLYKRTLRILPASPPYFKGRFSNGPVWVEYVHWAFPKIPFYIYAEAGATAANYKKVSSAPQYIFLKNLERLFLQFKKKNDVLTEKDLIIVWMGSNDYIGLEWLAPEDVERIMQSFRHFNEKMVALGARHLLYVNLPDLGQIPRSLQKENNQAFSQVTDMHNQGLEQLYVSLPSDVSLLIYPLDEVFEQAKHDAAALDIINVTDACYQGNWRRAINTQIEIQLPQYLPEKKLTEIQALLGHPILMQSYFTHFSLQGRDQNDCRAYFFWDDLHPSARVHKLLGNAFIKFLHQHFNF